MKKEEPILILICISMAGLSLLAGCSASQKVTKPASHSNVPEEERLPEFFEEYLKEHPDEGDHRVAALVWYNRRQRNPEKLKEHTFHLIEHHPSSMHIYFENHWLLFSDHTYRTNVISHLEKKIDEGLVSANTHWILGEVSRTGAIPPHDPTPEKREKFLKYFQISNDVVLVTSVNTNLFKKATFRYFV